MKHSIAFKTLFFFSLLFTGLALKAQQDQANKATQQAIAGYTYKITGCANNTYGYDIYGGGKLLVHQPTIPALPGNEGFKTKGAAEKVARLVITKIKKGEMPPTVSVEEMNKLKAL